MMEVAVSVLFDPYIALCGLILYFARLFYEEYGWYLILSLFGLGTVAVFQIVSGRPALAEFANLTEPSVLLEIAPSILLAFAAVFVWYFSIDLFFKAWNRNK